MALVFDSTYIERALGDVRDVENPTQTDATSLSFLDINYSVTSNAGEYKQILKSCEGQFAKSKLTAIMGPSGAGKTSLLNILAGRTQATSGSLLLNSEQVSPTSLVYNVSSYVQQDDCMLATQTCRETVTMAALLTLPIDMSKEEKLAKAEATIKVSGLELADLFTHVVHTCVRPSYSGWRSVPTRTSATLPPRLLACREASANGLVSQ